MRPSHRRLPGVLPALIASLPLALSACVPRYVPPSADEPHAVVKLRLAYHATSGPQLSEQVFLGDRAVPLPERFHQRRLASSAVHHVRVRPQPTRWQMRSVFSHTVTRMEMVPEQERYPCGSRTVGFGNTQRTETQYCTRTRMRQRVRQEVVVDGACAAAVPHTPRVGATYVLQYDYYGPHRCTAQLFEQLPQPDGTFRLQPIARGQAPR